MGRHALRTIRPLPDNFATLTPPKIDVYDTEGRLRLVAVTAEEAAKYANVSESFVWSCAKARWKVPSETGYTFHINTDEPEPLNLKRKYRVLSEAARESNYIINRRLFLTKVREAGYERVTDFCKSLGISSHTFRETLRVGWKGFPKREMIMKISEALNVPLEELVISIEEAEKMQKGDDSE